MRNLIEQLEYHRINMGITKEKMARLIDIPYNTYMRWCKHPERMSPLARKRVESLDFMK
jgi:DNA-binding XRE family transcriptional regulator